VAGLDDLLLVAIGHRHPSLEDVAPVRAGAVAAGERGEHRGEVVRLADRHEVGRVAVQDAGPILSDAEVLDALGGVLRYLGHDLSPCPCRIRWLALHGQGKGSAGSASWGKCPIYRSDFDLLGDAIEAGSRASTSSVAASAGRVVVGQEAVLHREEAGGHPAV